MAWFNRKKINSPTGFAEQDNSGMWLQYFNQINGLSNDVLEKFSNDNAYRLATTIAEVFIPIDAIADRVAGIDFKIRNRNTLEIYEPKGNLKRLIEKPNPFDRLSDVIYKSVFTELSDGNGYVYTKTPKSIVNPTVDNISNIWVLDPSKTSPVLLKEIPNPFLITDKKDLIHHYKSFFFIKHQIEPRYIHHTTALGIGDNCKGISPLNSAQRNINNILAVYQARYNVYAKNGNAGILAKAPSSANSSIQEAVDPTTRDSILKDLMNRNGLTKDKNFIGLSSTPLQFIKTLGTIAELQPFEETLEDSIKIAGVFGVDKELIPRKDNSTFTNKEAAEVSLWQNVIKSMATDKANDLTKIFYLPEELEFFADFSNIEALQDDKKTSFEADAILINNLSKLAESNYDVKEAFTKLQEKYNG
jgi:phage portal protein BeeE